MAGRDLTDGRATRSIAIDVGVVSSTAIWQNTSEAYDVAVGGLPFFYAINDARPYIRQTAPFKKDQFDNGQEPGEQSLTGWWIRSQMSFHSGSGINFYDPATTDENGHYRFHDSKGLNTWTKGQVTLLRSCTQGHVTTDTLSTDGRPGQFMNSIKWGTTNGVLMLDGLDVDKIDVDGTVTHFIDSAAQVYAICNDGTYAYWLTNVSSKATVYKKPLTGSTASTADQTQLFQFPSTAVTTAIMEYTKERIIMCMNGAVYEFSTSASSVPTAIYTHPNSSYVWTSITSSGPAIYISGFNGIQSTISKFTLNTSTGIMPTLTSAITAAEMPTGEKVYKIHYYLGYLSIGTSKGIRVASVSDQDGSLSYGPLIVETTQPCYDFAARSKYIWCATGVAGEPGVIRIDLGNEIETLRFAYANDIYYSGVSGRTTTACAFLGETDQLAFSTNYLSTSGYVYTEHATDLNTTGYLQTGNIRYGTLEPKNFKRLIGRGDFTYGSMTLETVDKDGTEYDHIAYDSSVSPIEITTSSPALAQEYVAYKFILYRDATTTSAGPTFKGYQAKATIATPRQRVMKFPVYCFDVETDRYNTVIGYEGRALARLLALETVEEGGDVLTWQDLSTGESRQVVIEQVTFTRMTPPDKRFDGFGGVLEITIRTV